MMTFSSFDVFHPSETGSSTCMLLKLFQYAQVDVKAIQTYLMQFHTIITSGLFCVKYIKLSLRDIVQNRMFNLHGICCFLQFNKLHLYPIPLSNKLRNLSLWVFHIICSFVFLIIRLFLNCRLHDSTIHSFQT